MRFCYLGFATGVLNAGNAGAILSVRLCDSAENPVRRFSEVRCMNRFNNLPFAWKWLNPEDLWRFPDCQPGSIPVTHDSVMLRVDHGVPRILSELLVMPYICVYLYDILNKKFA